MILSCFPFTFNNKDRTFWLGKDQCPGSSNSYLSRRKWLKNLVITILLPRWLGYRKKTYWTQKDKYSGLADWNSSCDATVGIQASAVTLKLSLTQVPSRSVGPSLSNMTSWGLKSLKGWDADHGLEVQSQRQCTPCSTTYWGMRTSLPQVGTVFCIPV